MADEPTNPAIWRRPARPTKPLKPWRMDTNAANREVVRTVMGLSTASLLLPVVFARDVLGREKEAVGTIFDISVLYASWGLLGLAIFIGIIFHYLSVKWLILAWGRHIHLNLGFKKLRLSDNFISKCMDFAFWGTMIAFGLGIFLIVKLIYLNPPNTQSSTAVTSIENPASSVSVTPPKR